MQPIGPFACRQRFLIFTVALIAIAVAIPSPSDAQEAAQKNVAVKDDAKAPLHSAATAPADLKPVVARLIVGAWDAGGEGAGKQIVFNQDGTYEDHGVNVYCEEHEVSSAEKTYMQQVFVRSQGKWRLEDGRLVLANNDRIAFWDKASNDDGNRTNATCCYEILRLDDGLLRLRLIPNATGGRSTFFFRRAEEKSVEKEFAAVSPEYRRVLAAAEMTPEEAAAFVDWLKTQKLDSPAQLEVIDRLMQARRHKITLAQLFGMSAEEVAAFREVVQQANGDYERLVRLAASDELTAAERQSLGKATSVVTDLRRLTEQIPMDMQTRTAVYGRGGYDLAQQMDQEAQQAMAREMNARRLAELNATGAGGGRGGRATTTAARGRRGFGGRNSMLAPNADTLDETQHEAVVKLNASLDDLGQWFWRTVFPVD